MLIAGTGDAGTEPVVGGLFVAAALVFLLLYHDLVSVGGLGRHARAGLFASSVSLGVGFVGVVLYHATAI